MDSASAAIDHEVELLCLGCCSRKRNNVLANETPIDEVWLRRF